MKKAIYMGIGRQKDDHEQRVFMVDPPHEGYEYVLVSARDLSEYMKTISNAMQVPPSYLSIAGHEENRETYIFGCTASGEVISWRELEGSFKGKMNIAQALQNAGYEIISEVQE